jgi:hypothetical protein
VNTRHVVTINEAKKNTHDLESPGERALKSGLLTLVFMENAHNVTTSFMIGALRHQTRGPQSSIQPRPSSQTPSGHRRT